MARTNPLVALCLWGPFAAGPAFGQVEEAAEAPPPPLPAEDEGRDEPTVRFTPGVWISRLSGEVSLGNDASAADITLETDLELDELESTLNGEFRLRCGRVNGWMSIFDFDTNASTTIDRPLEFGDIRGAPGETARSTFQMASIAASAGYHFEPVRNENFAMRLIPRGSVRYVDIAQDVTFTGPQGGRDDGGLQALGLFVGAAVEIDLYNALVFDFSIDLGPSLDGGSMLQIGGTINWLVTPNFGVAFGYRQLDLWLEEGEYEFSGRLAGLFVAGSIRF